MTVNGEGATTMREVVRVPTADDMRTLGRRLAGLLRRGDLVVLSGPLGAGKTTLVQGIGEGLQVRGPITSPTFIIARVHPPLGDGPGLAHVDAYRLGDVAEVDDLDLDTAATGCVTVVEWGEGLVEGLAEDRLEVSIQSEPDGDARIVRLTGVGDRWADTDLPRVDHVPGSGIGASAAADHAAGAGADRPAAQ